MSTSLSTTALPGRQNPEEPSPQELVTWSLHSFIGKRMALTTGFGMEGCALIDMYARHRQPVKVIYIDTGFLFPETHALRRRLERRYPNVSFEARFPELSPRDQARRHGDRLWERAPDRCCRLRKVEPMRQALAAYDVWVTALRRSQSEARRHLLLFDWEPRHGVLKFSPFAAWDRPQVWEYVRAHHVPFNELHDRGYPSIGCTHCTQAVAGATAADYSREGRWNGRGKAECGLHTPGSGTAGPETGQGRPTEPLETP